MGRNSVHCIYVAASQRDARFTRICVASIRSFYPDIPIRLLAGGPLEPGLGDELARYWNVGIADLTGSEWGWGFIKLEPLFGREGETFLVLDSDTVMTGPLLDVWVAEDALFVVDDEQQSDVDAHRLYYNWREIGGVDPTAAPPRFLFNSGQWFGTAGKLSRRDFEAFIDWSEMPPRHRHPRLFMPGDQGILNYVLNQKAMLGEITVAPHKIMVWPNHGLQGISVQAINDGTAPIRVIHWAGIKASRLGSMAGLDILAHFERIYYERLPRGQWKRVCRQIMYPAAALCSKAAVRVQKLGRRLRSRNGEKVR